MSKTRWIVSAYVQEGDKARPIDESEMDTLRAARVWLARMKTEYPGAGTVLEIHRGDQDSPDPYEAWAWKGSGKAARWQQIHPKPQPKPGDGILRRLRNGTVV